MSRFRKLSHSVYECKYHIIICPKYRYKVLRGEVSNFCKQRLYQLASQKDQVEILELNIQPDHIHLLISIPPKYQVSQIVGFLKGKVSIGLFQHFERLGRTYWGSHFWSRGYCVSTVGLDEEMIRKYVKYQEKKEKELEKTQPNQNK